MAYLFGTRSPVMDALQSFGALARRYLALTLVALTGVGATIAAWTYVSGVVDAQAQARFDRVVASTIGAIQVRMDAYVAALRATRGIFLDGREPGRRAFREFTASLEMPRQYPGIQGIGFTKLLKAEDVELHEEAVREEGFQGYRVWPRDPRDVYTTILYLEPFDWRNQRAFGFDMFNEPVRREAMERARDSGDAAASGKVELVQEAGKERQAGFLVYLPVFSRPVASVGERREDIVGWVYAPFRSGDLLHGTLDEEASQVVDIEIYDGAEMSPDALLFDGDVSRELDAAASRGLHRTHRIEMGGRTWTLRFAAKTAFLEFWERWLARFVLAAGLALTALLVWITRREGKALDEAVEARARAVFLAESGKILGSSLDYARNLQSVATLATSRLMDGCIIYVSEPVGAPLFLASHRNAAVAARAHEALAGSWVDPESRIGASAVLRTGRPEVLNDVQAANLPHYSANPGMVELYREAGTRHVLTIPLFARGDPLGAITLTSNSRPFGPAEVALGEDLARLAVAAIDTGRLYRRAQESLRLRDEFLSIASHELKTPLTSLTLQSESLRASAARATPEGVARKADAIRRNVDRLSRLVATLLDLSRITAGRLDIHREDVDLVEVVTDVIARFEEEARRAGCELRLDAPVPVTGHWDRLRLDQVVTNLVANAVKYGPGKPVDVRVEKRLDNARLTIRDQGIGISDVDQKRIFERFERAVSDRNYGGFGLGLWIVRRIIEAMGGTIHVESSPGEGATFTVELRRVADDLAALRGDEPRAKAVSVPAENA
jgi:signal transduction histidine kinase/CHASE1-domain containing sensor protein